MFWDSHELSDLRAVTDVFISRRRVPYTITRDRVPELRRNAITPAEKQSNITTPSHRTRYPNRGATPSHLQRKSVILLHHHTWPCTRTDMRYHHTCRERVQYYYTITCDHVPKPRCDTITPAEKECNITTPSHATMYGNRDVTPSHLQRNSVILLHHHTWPCMGTETWHHHTCRETV